MPRSRSTRNMERVSDSTPSSRRRAKENRANGRGGEYHTYSSGARSVDAAMDNIASMKNAWDNNENVATYTSSKSGKMSTDGKTAGGSTNTFSKETGSGKGGKMANRRVRHGETRLAFNNVDDAVSRMGGTYESLKSRGLTDTEIWQIYGVLPPGARTTYGGGEGAITRRASYSGG